MTGEGLRHRQLVSRALQGGGIDIEYEVILEQICADTDCSNAQEIADALYDAVTETMQNDIDSGVFAQIVTATAEEQGAIVEVAIANSDFEDLVVLVLALASIWYPAWTTGEYCSNDGEQPFYMKYNPGSWLYNSRDACCTRYYSYDYASCMGIDSMAVIGFYPAWDGTKKCRNDAEVPDYMRRNPSQWVYDDLESCCERYYSSEQAGCLTNSGGNPTDSASLEWYVDHENEVCVQDCLEDSGGQCGGLVSPWKTLFESPSACCETTLTWISTSSCTFASLGQTNPGTFKWYSNFAENRCVMDCPKSATCGGILESAYVDLHETAADCCSSKLGWVEIDNCTSESTNTPISSSGTDGYYLNERLNRCVQNCIGVAPCGGLRKSWNELFSTAGDCCATKLWWLERSTCLSGTS